MRIVIPAPVPFNMRVFKISVPITHGGKILPPYPPCCGYPWRRIFLTSLPLPQCHHYIVKGPIFSIKVSQIGIELTHHSIDLYPVIVTSSLSFDNILINQHGKNKSLVRGKGHVDRVVSCSGYLKQCRQNADSEVA